MGPTQQAADYKTLRNNIRPLQYTGERPQAAERLEEPTTWHYDSRQISATQSGNGLVLNTFRIMLSSLPDGIKDMHYSCLLLMPTNNSQRSLFNFS